MKNNLKKKYCNTHHIIFIKEYKQVNRGNNLI